MKALGPIVEGVGSFEAGKYTRKVMQVNAVNAERDGAAEVARLGDVARLAMGRQIAGLAASGFSASSGSALDALRESAIESELDIMATRRKAQGQATAYKTQGALAYASGYNAMTSGIISGVAAMIPTPEGGG